MKENGHSPSGNGVNGREERLGRGRYDFGEREPLLTREDERALFIVIERGRRADERLARNWKRDRKVRRKLRREAREGGTARERVINANRGLVAEMTKRYYGLLPFDDLMQEGQLGLFRAIERFDYRRGTKFSTFANYWIWQAMGRAVIRQRGVMTQPVHVGEMVNKLRRVQSDLLAEGDEIDREELARRMGLGEEELEELEQFARDTVSLDAQVAGEKGDGELIDFQASGDGGIFSQAVDDDTRRVVREAVARLSERQREILVLRYGIGREDGRGMSLEQVGKLYGVTRERIRQIEEVAVGRMKEILVGMRVEANDLEFV